MFDHLLIYDRGERTLVGLADLLLSAGRSIVPRRSTGDPPVTRILVLRLERIGDLLMTLPALAELRAALPEATIDLVVGSWNESLARLVRVVDEVHTLDAPWLARDRADVGYGDLIRRARSWRTGGYDLALNFEGDIRSNALMALSGAPRRAGFGIKGGAALLTEHGQHERGAHVAVNAGRLVDTILTRPSTPLAPSDQPMLDLPESARFGAGALLEHAREPLIGLHASGGRAIKQWDPARFAETANRIVAVHGGTVVLTGSSEDRAIVEQVKGQLTSDTPVVDLTGRADLPTLAAVLERLTLYITGDTGPMHLAAAVGTPIVGVFGPSDPANYRPWVAPTRATIVRVDIWCSPCNQIRRPPSRCVGHGPDCLVGVEVDAVVDAATALLDRRTRMRSADADLSAL
ncbi:MAG: glycosyltransferase family 9 protein [Vicinamibacterales bacterium]|nr:glycosyltransferase family 9 protein [Vicinamibacterales bacterium]